MDEDDYKYAEFIFQSMKQKPKNRASWVADYTHGFHKGNIIKPLSDYDPIFKFLEEIDLIKIEYNTEGRRRPQFLELSEIGVSVPTVAERIRQIKFEKYNQQKKEEKNQELIRDQSEYFKRQNFLLKHWYLPVTLAAILGALIQKIFGVL